MLKSENAGKQEKDDADICPKCHHNKGRRKRRNIKKNDMKLKNVDDSDLSHMRQKEEKEIIQKFSKETLSADHFCNCSNHQVDNKQRKVNFEEEKILLRLTLLLTF